MLGSGALVGGVFVEGDEVEHFSQSGVDAVAVDGFQFRCRQVGGGMGNHFVGYKTVVSGQEDFSHDVTFVAKVFDGAFCAVVVKTTGDGLFGVVDDGIGGGFVLNGNKICRFEKFFYTN